jgi:hypothetical protein
MIIEDHSNYTQNSDFDKPIVTNINSISSNDINMAVI